MEFRIITARELTPAMFELHPIWAEYYEPEEIDDIVSWGYDKEKTTQEMFSKFYNQEHPYYTVPIEQFPPIVNQFFTKADLVTKNGTNLRGAVMDHGELVLSIFIDEQRDITLSSHPNLYDLVKKEIMRLSLELNMDPTEFEEIKFKTTVQDQKGKPIEGVFHLVDPKK